MRIGPYAENCLQVCSFGTNGNQDRQKGRAIEFSSYYRHPMSPGSGCEKKYATHLIFNLVQLYPKGQKRGSLLMPPAPWVHQHDRRLSTYNLPIHSQHCLLRLIWVSAAPASRALSIGSVNFISLASSIAESNRTLKFFSGGYSDRAGGQGSRGGSEYKGTGKVECGHGGGQGEQGLGE